MHDQTDCGCGGPGHHMGHGRGHHGQGHHSGCCCTHEHGLRRFYTRAEMIAGLEEYLADLRAEVKGVEERLAELKKAA